MAEHWAWFLPTSASGEKILSRRLPRASLAAAASSSYLEQHRPLLQASARKHPRESTRSPFGWQQCWAKTWTANSWNQGGRQAWPCGLWAAPAGPGYGVPSPDTVLCQVRSIVKEWHAGLASFSDPWDNPVSLFAPSPPKKLIWAICACLGDTCDFPQWLCGLQLAIHISGF